MRSFLKKNCSHSSNEPKKKYFDSIVRNFLNEADDMVSLLKEKAGVFYFPMDMQEDNQYVYISLDLPGMSKEDLDMNINDQILTIKGKRQYKCPLDNCAGKEKNCSDEHSHLEFHYSEMRYGSFKRQISLPSTIDASQVKAHYDNGVLKIKIKKLKSSENKKVIIE